MSCNKDKSISVIVPARNERAGLSRLLPRIRAELPQAEIIVVDDGSDEDLDCVCLPHNVEVLKHPFNMGNGAAVKSGARRAASEILIFLDADGQHDPADIPRLLAKLNEGFAMAVGARSVASQASAWRGLANRFYNRLASWIVGHPIADLTCGFRAVEAKLFKKFLHLLPNTFSYPTTITMAFFRSGYPIAYVPITAAAREGKSHIKPVRDGLRFLLIIFKIGTLYSPLKIFFPISCAFFAIGLGYYAYTFATAHRFTNMSGLLFVTAVLVFLIGLVSEQITALMYSPQGK
jgi:glycosyltransferase involved in cell wall biosynthesis